MRHLRRPTRRENRHSGAVGEHFAHKLRRRLDAPSAGVGWAIWEDPVNMNLFDAQAGTWLTAIIDALLPP